MLLLEDPLSLSQSSAEVTAYAAGAETARTAVTAADANRVRAERMDTQSFRHPCDGRLVVGSSDHRCDVIHRQPECRLPPLESAAFERCHGLIV
ncbi:hypothetical protein ASD26_19440 [Streptomyces sp. Root1319]|nr:hypothetical protein ASD26_19440 [Streptomyces sp. Root1319]